MSPNLMARFNRNTQIRRYMVKHDLDLQAAVEAIVEIGLAYLMVIDTTPRTGGGHL
jgi:hypothetical protein